LKKEDIEKSWQYKELRKYLEVHSNDQELTLKAVHLINSEQVKKIDSILIDNLWPAVIKGVGTSGFWLKPLKEGYPKSAIEDENHIYCARSLTFLLEDPNRPLSYGSDVSWYCRGKITCSVMDYMVSFDLFVYLPVEFSFKKIIRLLKNPKFAGMPPNLSYESSSDNKGILCIAFSKGAGAGWGLHSYEEAANRICEAIKQNIMIAKTLYTLEEDYSNTLIFNKLERSLVQTYENF
jgi:hypothetical protein